MTSLIGSALALGFLGSAHCAVMCGPLATAACGGCAKARWRGFASYQAGRLFAYTFAGAVFGAAGARALRVVPLAGAQTVLALLIAAAAFIRGVRLLASGTAPVGPRAAAPRPSTLARLMASLLPRRGVGLGLATGVLPCGLLAGAWALAATAGSAGSGAAVMLAFAIATAPALALAVAAAGPARRLAASPKFAGLAWCLLGLALVARPLLQQSGHCH